MEKFFIFLGMQSIAADLNFNFGSFIYFRPNIEKKRPDGCSKQPFTENDTLFFLWNIIEPKTFVYSQIYANLRIFLVSDLLRPFYQIFYKVTSLPEAAVKKFLGSNEILRQKKLLDVKIREVNCKLNNVAGGSSNSVTVTISHEQ